MEKIDYALESFKNIQDLIKFADQKAGAVLVVTGLIFTGYVQYLERLTLSHNENLSSLEVVTFGASTMTLLSLFVVIFYTIFEVLKPRTAKYYNEEESSIFYYEHIFKKGKVEVLAKYDVTDEHQMLKDLVDQQHEIAGILTQKNNALSTAFIWLFISLVSVTLFIICSNQL